MVGTILIAVGSTLGGLLLIGFVIWANQYTKVGPNEVLIISGRRGRKRTHGYRIVRGGGTFVWPFREKVQRMSLELMQFDVRTQETYTTHGVPVQIDGVCMVKIDGTDEGIENAAEQFLSRSREDIVRTALQAVEGHMRAAVGGQSIEDIYRERQRLVAAVRDLAEPDLERMGLDIVSLTVRNIADKQGYLEALGRPRTAQVKRDAIRGEAEAEREAKAARYEADLAIAREIAAVADARREEAAALGAGEADALRLRGLAEAEAMAAKARSWGDYNEAAVTDRVLEVLPQLAAAVSAPLAKTDRIVMIGGNGGATAGASRLTKDLTQIVAELPALLEALTGMKFDELVKRVPGLRDAAAGSTDGADTSAEEIR